MVRVAFALHRRAGVSQGKNLGVRFSRFWMEAASDHVAIFDEDAADLGVGSRGVGGDRLGQVQCFSHEVEVVACRVAVVCALRIDGTSPCAATRSRNRMPARAFVLRCSRRRRKLSHGRCAQRGCRTSSIQRPFWPPSGRSHRASPLLWDVMHQCARVLCCNAGLLALRRAALAALAALVTNSPQRWRKRCCVLQWIYQDVWLYSVLTLVLLVAHAYVRCTKLASVFKAAS